MPYRLIHFSPGLVQIEVSGHIETADVEMMLDEGELMLRHVVEPFDTIVDATHFTGLNPLALTRLRALPLPPQLNAVAVILGGWQLLASKALPRIDGLHFVGSLEAAHEALAESPALAAPRAELPEAAPQERAVGEQAEAAPRERAVGEPAEAAPQERAVGEPAAAAGADAVEAPPQVRRLPSRPLPEAHRRPAATGPVGGIAGSVLRGLTRQLNFVSKRIERLQDW